MWYNDKYERTIEFIRNLNKEITMKEYNKIASKNDLLNSKILKVIENKKFNIIIKDILKVNK